MSRLRTTPRFSAAMPAVAGIGIVAALLAVIIVLPADGGDDDTPPPVEQSDDSDGEFKAFALMVSAVFSDLSADQVESTCDNVDVFGADRWAGEFRDAYVADGSSMGQWTPAHTDAIVAELEELCSA